MGLLHTFCILEVDRFGDRGACGRNDLIVVLYLLALELDGIHDSLSSVIHEDGSHFQDGLRVEILRWISYRYIGIHLLGDDLEDLGITCHLHTFSHFRHLLGGRTTDDGNGKRRAGYDSKKLIHKMLLNMVYGFPNRIIRKYNHNLLTLLPVLLMETTFGREQTTDT